ncbi:MAG TPA: SDR family oxidoreductase [Candidatus Omnitrophota bacterium]|nr:SDR family oxidoreductase [Candidatus Omnitrophota bacterium]HQO58783.1 SDR family oxidoreductase [Candidatus Omnitrophota bacterium]
MAQSPKNKAALITGGAQRLGAAMAVQLAQMGYDIALHYNRSRKQAEITQRAVERTGAACRLFPADLGNAKAAERLIGQAAKTFPGLNLLVNNASVYQHNTITKADSGLYDTIMAVNLKAPCLLTSHFARICKKGDVINMLDARVTRNRTPSLYYLLSKKALKEFTQMAALAMAPDVRVNAIAPGAILPPKGKGEAYMKSLAQTIPQKETQNPDQVLRALVFLLENPCYTGQILYVDGGTHLI